VIYEVKCGDCGRPNGDECEICVERDRDLDMLTRSMTKRARRRVFLARCRGFAVVACELLLILCCLALYIWCPGE